MQKDLVGDILKTMGEVKVEVKSTKDPPEEVVVPDCISQLREYIWLMPCGQIKKPGRIPRSQCLRVTRNTVRRCMTPAV